VSAPEPDDDPDARYFQDAERAFVSRRGDPLFISNADWVRLRRWKKKGVPLRVIRRGIEDAFDLHAHSFQRGLKVRSMRYCEAAIEAAADRWRRALTEGLPGRRAADVGIERIDEALRVRLAGGGRGSRLEGPIARARAALRDLPTERGAAALPRIDAALRRAEDALAADLEALLSTDEGAEGIAALRLAAEASTAAYRHRMPPAVYADLVEESVRRRLLNRFGVPRLILAELA
jgi:hypothetical protein